MRHFLSQQRVNQTGFANIRAAQKSEFQRACCRKKFWVSSRSQKFGDGKFHSVESSLARARTNFFCCRFCVGHALICADERRARFPLAKINKSGAYYGTASWLDNVFDYFPFCSAIHLFVRASSMSSGSAPPSRISSWNLRMSNLGPSSFLARSRSSRIFNWPSL